MKKIKNIISCMLVCALVVSLCSCGSKDKSKDYAAMYGETIAGLEDDELFAIIQAGASSPVLLVTSQFYEDGLGNQASIWCDVYYPISGDVKKIGVIEGWGTAYPVSYDKKGLYVASGHGMQRFEIDEKNGTIILAEGIYEQFDQNGNASYTLEKGDKTKGITEKAYYKAFKKYSESEVVNFSYGASGT